MNTTDPHGRAPVHDPTTPTTSSYGPTGVSR